MTRQDPRDCDVVLEGGVTSAVIYAGLLARLSKTYRLRSLGGTSAGAVAAAAGAIAERARLATCRGKAFDALGAFPSKLAEVDAEGTVLFKLFQARPATRRGLRIVTTALEHGRAGHWLKAVLPVALAVVRNFPIATLFGALAGLWLIASAVRQTLASGFAWEQALSIVLGVPAALLLGLGAAFVWGLYSTLRGMLDNHYGLCNGMPAPGHHGEALTPTLHALYNGLAGRSAQDPPVVFGWLWGNGPQRKVDLQVITTALELKRPLRLPNDPGVDPLRAFFYDPVEWSALFPEPVMQWLDKHQRRTGARVTSRDGRVLAALPMPQRWPIVVAVRLSLSFPGLLSAIPMYTLHGRGSVRNAPDASGDVQFIADKVYFSDGGITSNCPIHLFDAPLPTRPTFGVNLWRLEPGDDEGGPIVWMSSETTEPELRPTPPTTGGTWARAFRHVAAIVRTGIDWRDTVQRTLPGYRERIVHIGLPRDRGGLNLAMPSAIIEELGVTGAKAADRLVQEFTGPRTTAAGGVNAWDLHRWVRMRSTLAATRQHLSKLRERVRAGRSLYRRLPRTTQAPPPPFVDGGAVEQAQVLMDGVERLMNEVDAASAMATLEDNAPQPAPTLRMSSPW